MSACDLNAKINLEDYQKQGVSAHEIHEHFLETGEIGSPAFIKYKVEQRKKGIVPKSELEDVPVETYNFTEKSVNDWLSKLSKSLGVDYQIISKEEAQALHDEKGASYGNEKSFFHNGKAYFVSGTLTPESVVHEFSHPFVKMIAATNPELFEELYLQLANTEEGSKIIDTVRNLYGNEDASMKEEVLVRALTQHTISTVPTENYKGFIQNLMFHIKQALRKFFGKGIDISKLSPMTSLKDLAEILKKGDSIEMQVDIYTNEDVFDYLRDYSDFVDSFQEILDNHEYDAVQSIINNTYDVAMEQLATMQDTPELSALADVIANEYGQGYLYDIQKDLGPLHTKNETLQAIGKKDKNGLVNSQYEVLRRLKTLTNNLFSVEKVLDAINSSMDEVGKLSSKEQMNAYHYYSTYLRNWSTVVNELQNASEFQYERNELHDLADKLKRKLSAVEKKMATAKVNAVADVMYDSLKDEADKVLNNFNDEMNRLATATQGLRDQKYLEFHNMTEAQYKLYQRLKANGSTRSKEYIALHSKWLDGSLEFNKEKLISILNGESKDSNWFNTMIESASLNTDPTIHSVQQHIQEQIARFEALAKTHFEDYLNAINPHIKANGGKFQNRGTLGKKFGFKDNAAKIVNGELVNYQEWVFLNKWKDYRADQVQLRHAVETAKDAYLETNSDEDFRKLEEARDMYSKWKNKYMHQEFSAEFYETAEILNRDEIGKEAKVRRNEIYQLMTDVENDESMTTNDKMKVINNLWDKLKELQAIYDVNGVKKTGKELEIAERLKEYNNARGKFYTFEERPDEFQDAYNSYVNELEEAGFPAGTDDHEKMLNQWLKNNTVVAVKNSVADAKQKLLDRRKELLQELILKNKSIGDDSEERQLISDMIKFVTDDFQPDGRNASSAQRKKVKEAHVKIEALLDNLYSANTGGLTKGEDKRLKELLSLESEGPLLPAQKQEKLALLDKQLKLSDVGLSDAIIQEIKSIDRRLSKYSTTETTTAFNSTLIGIMENNDDLFQLFKSFLSDNEIEIDFPSDAIGQDFIDFVRSNKLDDAKALDSAFKTFVDENFYVKEKYSYDDSKYIKQLTPTDLWTYRASSDVYDYKTKMLKDVNGKNLGLIQIDGVYRTPSLAYQQRVMKDEYVTEKVVGVTVDNAGRFLPKDEASEKYVNRDYEALRNEDPEAFEFMEELKAQHLKAQELAQDEDKLYLSYPQTRKTRLENWLTGNVFRFRRRLYDFWKGSGDDLESMGNAAEMTSADFIQEHKFGVFEHPGSNMPVKGVARLNYVEDQSTDILKTMPEYMASIYHKRGAAEGSTYARSVADVVNKVDEQNQDKQKGAARIISKAARMFNLSSVWKGRSVGTRAKALNSLIERDIDGVFVKKSIGSGPRVEKTITMMNRSVGFKLFSANPISGLKNYAQIKLVAMTHAFAFDKMNALDGLVGEAWAMAASTEISKNIRSRGQKGYREQLVQLFDPAGGRTMETMGDNLSRTLIGDTLELKFLQKGRKWMELQGTIQAFAGLMNNKKVTIVQNGITKKIPYLKAFELVDGRLQTKEGVEDDFSLKYDAEGNPVLGRGLVKQRLEMQQVIMTWNGTFAKKDAALVERNIFAKQLFFLRRHLIPMSSKNYAFGIGTGSNVVKKRMNWTTGKAEYGHFTSTAKTLYTLVRHWRNGVKYMTADELKSVMYVINYTVIGSFVLPYLQGLVSVMKPGEDDDDDEKYDYQGMNMRSGYLGKNVGPLTEDPKFEFYVKGYLLNQLALLNSQSTNEYNALNVTHITGTKEYLKNVKNPSPVNVSIMLNTTMEILSYITKQESDTYSRDNGVYVWEKAGYEHGKLYNALFELVGINGKNLNPVKALKDAESFRTGKN